MNIIVEGFFSQGFISGVLRVPCLIGRSTPDGSLTSNLRNSPVDGERIEPRTMCARLYRLCAYPGRTVESKMCAREDVKSERSCTILCDI